jgi:porphobilinogen synthase
MQRLRRLRRSDALLRLFTETDVPRRALVPVLFVVQGDGVRREVPEGSGMIQVSVDRVEAEGRRARDGGAEAVMVFGVPAEKGIAHASDPNGLVARAVRALGPTGLVRMVDVCLCSYTHDGHCGLVGADGHVDNDATLPELARVAVALAEAGAEVVCPSDMMDGRVASLRAALDGSGNPHTLLMSYAAKMASAFYGPFRAAAESAPTKGDRRGYQMNPANRREAAREIEADVLEGADLLMIQPALTNLDLIAAARARWDLPIVAYQVSGEYAMLREAARAGRIDYARATRETLLSIRRAGADLVVTYAAPDVWDGTVVL